MGTRSLVGVMHGDNCKAVYCHYDGYLECTGEILQAHYNSAKANALVARGDNSGVKETVEEMNFYADRGETNVSFQTTFTFDEFLDSVSRCGAEYYYIMKDGVWYAGCVYETAGLVKNGLVPLADALVAYKQQEALM